MSTRKRPRASLLPEQDDEEDELSPRKSDLRASTRTSTPLMNGKKRKLDSNSSSNKLSTFGKKLGSVVGCLFRGQKNETDELAGENEDEEIALQSGGKSQTNGKLAATMPGKQRRTTATGGKTKAKDNENIWDVPDSDEEQEVVVAKVSAVKRGARVNGMGSAKKATPAHNGNSARKRKSVVEDVENEHEDEIPSTKIFGPGGTAAILEGDSDGGIEVELPRSSGRKGVRSKKVLESSPHLPTHRPEPQPSVVKRGRGRPKKTTLDQIVAEAKADTPKGILTPSKGRTLKSKKSVAFEQGANIDLGFKDIPSSAASKRSKKVQKNTEEEAEPENEGYNGSLDTACSVCSKTKVRKGNAMLLCDGCPSGVHLKCYGLSEVPEGDWFCDKCQADANSDVEDEELEPADDIEEDETALAAAPKTAIEPGETSCAVCSGLDSKIGNKIILCDSCDFAVHVKCYQLTEFPKGDWYCRTCLAVAGEDPFHLGIGDETVVAEVSADIPDIESFEEHLNQVQRAVLDKITGQRRSKLTGHDEEMQKVYQVVEQTILAGEGNSMLVIGARGCGKTTLVESVITDISEEHRDKFHVVRLNGFIHTDDKIASKEIWRQLGREMEAEDDGAGKPSNYADTLASLLALLSHPSEQAESQLNQTAKSVIFVLDEFDLFTTHSRQTLLYNLFDIAQARKAPIVVLGLTTRIDVVESLEKRVKSRFSHRHVHLSLPRSIPAFWEICKQGLIVSEDDIASSSGSADESPGQSEFLEHWNTMIEDLYTKDAHFKQILHSTFHRTKSVPALYTHLLLPIATLSLTNYPLALSTPQSQQLPPLHPPDSKLHLLPSLSALSLALLIAACRLDIIHDTDVCNFSMAYDEYSSLTSKHKIQTSASGVNALGGNAKVWGKDVAVGEWERLGEVGLLIPAGIGGGGGGARGEAGKGGRMWRVDVGLEEIGGAVEGLSAVMGKWCREI